MTSVALGPRPWHHRRDDEARARNLPPGDSIDALVTGGMGFVGANVARELVAAGASVRVLARPGGDRRALEGVRVEIADGDLLDPPSVQRAVAGVQTLYHVAADFRLWAPDPAPIYRTNVDGTRTVLEAAGEAGVQRIVYTSTVAVLGLPPDGRPGTEDTPVSLNDMVSDYERSKFLAERLALDLAQRGLPVVVVNPSVPFGPWDVKPTPTGQMVVDFMRGRMVAAVDTGLNVIHVRDVARGHVLAAHRGRPGERYILGHRNLSLTELFEILGEITRRRPPRVRVPHAMAWLGAACFEGVARLTRRPPAVSFAAVRMARRRRYFSAARAVRDLGLPQTDVQTALADAVAWFEAHGYAAP